MPISCYLKSFPLPVLTVDYAKLRNIYWQQIDNFSICQNRAYRLLITALGMILFYLFESFRFHHRFHTIIFLFHKLRCHVNILDEVTLLEHIITNIFKLVINVITIILIEKAFVIVFCKLIYNHRFKFVYKFVQFFFALISMVWSL